ncbi:MAG: PP2C family protein-serine/threonine phosphatase [Actinomycetota bacterium]
MRRNIRPQGTDVLPRLLYGPGRRRVVIGLIVAALGCGLVALVGTGADLSGSEARPLLALVILAVAVVGGLWPALVAVAAAFAVYAGFFAEGGLGADDVLVLVAYLAVALVVGYLEAASASARAGRQRLTFLAEANDLLSSSLDYERTLGEVTRLAVPGLADWCAITTFGPDGTTLTQEVAHVDPKKEKLVRDMSTMYPPDLSDPTQPLAQVLRTGRAIAILKVSEEQLAAGARDGEHLRAIRALDLRSAVIAPLQARGRTFGAMTMVMAESGRLYRSQDLTFVEQLARSASTALDNARLYRESSQVARTLQQSLLPADLPEIPGVEVAARYRAATEGTMVGGDFYDLFETGRGDWVMVVGDVCGKGPEAAALTGLVRHTIRAVSVREEDPSRVLRTVNRQILRGEAERFCTAMVARVRPNGERVDLTVSCAGHPPPLVLRPGRAVQAADCEGTLLRIFSDPQLVDRSVELGPGDSAVLYTDGAVERLERAGRGGDAHLVSLLWESERDDAAGIADRIYRDAAMDDTQPSRDDLAVIVLRVRPVGSA